MRKLIHTIFKDPFSQFHKNEPLDKKVLLTFLITAFSLVSIYYLNSIQKALGIFYTWGFDQFTAAVISKIQQIDDFQLLDLNYWAICSFFFYFIVPTVIIKYYWKENLSSYGLSFKGILKGVKYYGLFLLFMLPLVWMVSHTAQFQNSYPFYRLNYSNASYQHLVIWECFYFLQFLGLEFFFRGFIVHSLKTRFGYYSVFIMMIPYCMIHFGKPLPETIGAIFAGIILGSLSLKSNSIWLGVFLHFSVAIAMDAFAIWNS